MSYYNLDLNTTLSRTQEYWISQSLDDGTEYNATEYEAEIGMVTMVTNIYINYGNYGN